jgi:uncharacterized membrane protein YoaK (UPF0700 family)
MFPIPNIQPVRRSRAATGWSFAVIIQIAHILAACLVPAAIAGIRETQPRFQAVAHVGITAAEILCDCAGVVGGVVIHHNHFIARWIKRLLA